MEAKVAKESSTQQASRLMLSDSGIRGRLEPLIVTVIASYRDAENSVTLAERLILSSEVELSCIIVDDSPVNIVDDLISQATRRAPELSGRLISNYSAYKSGRGAAIRRGMDESLRRFPEVSFVLEMDGDGSHQVEDILKLIVRRNQSSVVIGSRYLKGSKISGWPLSRRVMSRILNLFIPRIFNLRVSDVTNGLRLYPRAAIEKLVATPSKTDSFIYLTESLVKLQSDFQILEIPVNFVNREDGESSVGARELSESFFGLLKLWVEVHR